MDFIIKMFDKPKDFKKSKILNAIVIAKRATILSTCYKSMVAYGSLFGTKLSELYKISHYTR